MTEDDVRARLHEAALRARTDKVRAGEATRQVSDFEDATHLDEIRAEAFQQGFNAGLDHVLDLCRQLRSQEPQKEESAGRRAPRWTRSRRWKGRGEGQSAGRFARAKAEGGSFAGVEREN